jgi:hypothetical protein
VEICSGRILASGFMDRQDIARGVMDRQDIGK